MGQPVARIGDPISHGGAIAGGSSNVFCNNIGVARVGDPVMCEIHGAQSIATGSTTVFCNGRGVARVGDLITCGATITGGSPNVYSG